MTFDQQLRAIVGAIAFTAPDRVRITSMRNAQREIVIAVQGNAFGGLTYALYTDWYCALPSDPAPATAPAASAAEFLAGLQAANPIPYRHEDGWTVTRADAKVSNWSGCRCSISQIRNAASAIGSVVPCANTSFASIKRLTA